MLFLNKLSLARKGLILLTDPISNATWSETLSILQSPSLVLVKPKKDMNNVSCRRDMTEIVLKAA